MRRGAAVAGALVLAAAAAGCGSTGDAAAPSAGGPVGWQQTPSVFVQPALPKDRILAGRVRNDSLRTVTLHSKDVQVLDGNGHEVVGFGRFVDTFVHGNIPLDIQPGPNQPAPSQTRLGYEVKLRPGQTAPVTVTWRLKPGDKPTAVQFASGIRVRIPGGRPKPIAQG